MALIIKKMKNILRTLFLFIFAVLISSCSNNEVIHFYSMDKENCITVITEDTIRYVIAGRTSETPDTNFIKLDIRRITELVDGVWICWLGNNKWEVVIHESKIIENKLDSSKYFFNTQLPKNDIGVPTEKNLEKKIVPFLISTLKDPLLIPERLLKYNDKLKMKTAVNKNEYFPF